MYPLGFKRLKKANPISHQKKIYGLYIFLFYNFLYRKGKEGKIF
jgi:hypothetical protein